MITMLARNRISKLMLGKLQKKVKRQHGEKPNRKREKKREKGKRTREKRKGKKRRKNQGRKDKGKTRKKRHTTGVTFSTHLTPRIRVCNSQLQSKMNKGSHSSKSFGRPLGPDLSNS